MKNGQRGTKLESAGGEERKQAANEADSRRRKPYRAPTVEKRRSLIHATLVSSGGTAGTLAGSGLAGSGL